MSNSIQILHVDDDPDFGDLVATFLERENEEFEVIQKTSAGDALDRLDRDAGVDCIISDYDMPGKNGIDFLEAVRDEFPELPFILFTGKGSEEVASDAISAGATDYLQKGGGT
ncbi:HTR-like protein, partial [Halobacteriales archaeon QS_4_66_20]